MLLSATGCAVKPARDREDVSDALRLRTGHGPRPTTETGETPFPEGTDIRDGLSQDEAVAIALWNNPAYQTELAELGFARADLVEAGLLKNPALAFLFPWGPKQWEATLRWPLESLWQRPRRVAVGQLNVKKVAEGLVQHGLDLASNVKIAFVDLVLAEERARLMVELADAEREIAALTVARLRAGDVSEMEADRARARALEVEQMTRRSVHDAEGSRARLLGLLGLAEAGLEFDVAGTILTDPAEPSKVLPSMPDLLEDAFAARPDLRAAELAIEIAGKKSGLARSQFMSISAILDANENGREGTETGPGVGVTIPLFDRGQGGKARAAAELDQAAHRYASVRNEIAARVREAYARLSEAREASESWRKGVVRLRSDTLHDTRRAREAGEVSHLAVLGARRDYVEALLQEAHASAELRRAEARLENAVGSTLNQPPVQVVRSP
jgi:cobalt-zinc-cadmium efflux system outer membrane protein